MSKNQSSANHCPSILNQLSPGVQVNVWFDHGPAAGRCAVFLGIRNNAAQFLTTQTGGPQVIFVPCNQIQAVSFSAPTNC